MARPWSPTWPRSTTPGAGSTWGVRIQEPPPPDEATRFRMEQGRETEGEARGGGGLDARASPCRGSDIDTWTHERTS